MFVSCYERVTSLLARSAMGFLEQAGFAPVGLDIAVENIDESPRLARFVASRYPCTPRSGLGCESPS